MVHYGKAELVISQREIVLASAFDAHPERFVRGMSVPPSLPEAAWINKPKKTSERSEVSMTEEAITIEGVEAGFSNRVYEVIGNDTKFNNQVSQNH
jgi:hypothetical protein